MKKVVSFLTAIMVSTSVLASESCSKFESKFNENQKRILSHAYAYGKPYGLEYSMPAIAWEESSAGEILLNYKDPAAGIYQSYAVTALKRENRKVNHANKSAILLELATDEIKSTAHGLSELLHWTNTRNSWKDVWASYNGGKDYKERVPKEYAERIHNRIKQLKKCSYMLKVNSIAELNLEVFKMVKELSGQEPKKEILKAWKNVEKKKSSKKVALNEIETIDVESKG